MIATSMALGTAATGAASVAGAGLTAAGLFSGLMGNSKANEAQKAIAQENMRLSAIISADQLKQETLRQNAMNFQAQGQMVQSIRNAQRARAQAVAAGANSGALGSSGIEGSFAQITGQSNEQQSTLRYNTALGNQMFEINKDITTQKNLSAQRTGQYNQDLSDANSQIDFGKSFMSLGSSFTSNATTFGNTVASANSFFGGGTQGGKGIGI